MQEFSKVYMPVLGVIVIFSGFWYVKAFFSFFGMNEVASGLGVEYIAQFSFSVMYDLITFENKSLSIQFFVVILLLLILAYLLPALTIKLPTTSKLIGEKQIQIAPFWLRLLVAAGVSFWWIFGTAYQIGNRHACMVLQGIVATPSTTDVVSSAEEYYKFYQAFGYTKVDESWSPKAPQIMEIWRNKDFVYFTDRKANCGDKRTVLKVRTSEYPITRISMEPRT